MILILVCISESEAGERLWKDPEYEPDNGPGLPTEDDDPLDTVKKITNRLEFIEAIKSDGSLLENGRDEFKDDKEIVHEAMKEAGGWY